MKSALIGECRHVAPPQGQTRMPACALTARCPAQSMIPVGGTQDAGKSIRHALPCLRGMNDLRDPHSLRSWDPSCAASGASRQAAPHIVRGAPSAEFIPSEIEGLRGHAGATVQRSSG